MFNGVCRLFHFMAMNKVGRGFFVYTLPFFVPFGEIILLLLHSS